MLLNSALLSTTCTKLSGSSVVEVAVKGWKEWNAIANSFHLDFDWRTRLRCSGFRRRLSVHGPLNTKFALGFHESRELLSEVRGQAEGWQTTQKTREIRSGKDILQVNHETFG